MKRMILLAGLMLPCSAQAATLNYSSFDITADKPEFYTIEATYSGPSFVNYGMDCCAYSYSKTITQVDNDRNPIQSATFSLTLTPGAPVLPDFFTNPILPVIMQTGATSVTFTLAEGLNHFQTVTGLLIHGMVGSVNYVESIHTPIPAALPMFLSGLGLLGWFSAWKRRRAMTAAEREDEAYELQVW